MEYAFPSVTGGERRECKADDYRGKGLSVVCMCVYVGVYVCVLVRASVHVCMCMRVRAYISFLTLFASLSFAA